MAKKTRTIRETMSGPFEGLPSWVKAAGVIGIPGVIALFLVYQFVEIGKMVQQNRLDLAIIAQHIKDDSQQGWVAGQILQRICLNTSKSDSDRLSCVATVRPQ